MFFHNNIIADAQPQTGALPRRFGGKKWLKYPGLNIRRNPWPVVCNFAVDICFIWPGSNGDPPFARPVLLFNGLSTIDYQVQENLIELLRHTTDCRQILQIRCDISDIFIFVSGNYQCIFNACVDIESSEFTGTVNTRKIKHTLNNPGDTIKTTAGFHKKGRSIV